MKGLKVDYKVVNEIEMNLGKVLDVYEEWLKNLRFLVSNRFILVDFFYFFNIEYFMNIIIKRLFEIRFNVYRWVVKIMVRLVWKKVCDVKVWYDKKKN